MDSEELMTEFNAPEDSELSRITVYPNVKLEQIEDINITVTNPTIKDKGLKKHVEYIISGYDNSGSFEVQRRYKDFFNLRELLVQNWPGCYIPQIPPKKALGNMLNNFIEQRRKLLELFLTKISCLAFIYESDEFQCFLKSPVPLKQVFKFIPYSILKISENYRHFFSEYEFYESINEEEDIEFNKQLFQKSLVSLEKFREQAETSVKSYSLYCNHSFTLFNQLELLNAAYVKHYNSIEVPIMKREKFVNPFYILEDWAKAEILDMEAILDSIEKRWEVTRALVLINNRIESESDKMEKAKLGKKTLGMKLSGKSPDEAIEIIREKLETLNAEKDAAECVIKIINGRLFNKDIPRIKKESLYKYEKIMRTYANVSTEEFEFFLEQAGTIVKALE